LGTISLTTIEEIVGHGRRDLTDISPSISPTFSEVNQPKSREEISELAKSLAHSVVIGFMEHDRGFAEHDRTHLDKAVDAFFQVFRHLFTRLTPLRVRRAAELYVDALVRHDEIENTVGHSRDQILGDPEWADVRRILWEFSRTLGLSDSYADEATAYWKYHGVRDDRYVVHCLESENILLTAAIGNSYWSKILGSLFVLLIECHDKHDSTGLEAGLEFATRYYEIILRAKFSNSQKTPVLHA
jgi:hypothetical protein